MGAGDTHLLEVRQKVLSGALSAVHSRSMYLQLDVRFAVYCGEKVGRQQFWDVSKVQRLRDRAIRDVLTSRAWQGFYPQFNFAEFFTTIRSIADVHDRSLSTKMGGLFVDGLRPRPRHVSSEPLVAYSGKTALSPILRAFAREKSTKIARRCQIARFVTLSSKNCEVLGEKVLRST